MKHLILAGLLLLGAPVAAQDFTGLARLDVTNSAVTSIRRGVSFDLYLSQAVPYRVFVLDEPRRLVMDFREIDWSGVEEAPFIQSDLIEDVRFGALRPGWSRLVADLAEPLAIESAGMEVDTVTGTARLQVDLRKTSEGSFAALAGAPPDPGWDMLSGVDPTAPPAVADDGRFVVVIDPGHGGIDPGAKRDGLREADLMLILAAEVAETINRIGGMEAVLTRTSDVFVPLQERMTRARAAGADAFISLHADALDGDTVTSGASVYTLNDEAQDVASQRMAERHDRGDLLAGLDLTGQDDTVATVLMDLARLETEPASQSLAAELVRAFGDTGARLNSRPRREAGLAVLNAADFPSVLVEVGFLSSVQDRDTLRQPEGRARVAAALVLGLQRWAAAEAARAPLKRQ